MPQLARQPCVWVGGWVGWWVLRARWAALHWGGRHPCVGMCVHAYRSAAVRHVAQLQAAYARVHSGAAHVAGVPPWCVWVCGCVCARRGAGGAHTVAPHAVRHTVTDTVTHCQLWRFVHWAASASASASGRACRRCCGAELRGRAAGQSCGAELRGRAAAWPHQARRPPVPVPRSAGARPCQGPNQHALLCCKLPNFVPLPVAAG